MKIKEILIDVLNYLDTYEQENSDSVKNLNTTDFLGFMNSHHSFESVKQKEVSGKSEDWREAQTSVDGSSTDVSILIVMLFRYAKGYIKKALKNSKIKTADDFSFMITLLTYDSMTKMELINLQVMEKTSGNEIINRLVKLGLVEQSQDENDKRSVRIRLSEMGKNEILSILPQMRMVSQIVVGNLNENEINTLAYILRKLDHYHNDIFNARKDLELQELIASKKA